MSAINHTPGDDWETLGKALTSAARAARSENRRLGRVTPETMQRVREAMAMADAALTIDDIKVNASGHPAPWDGTESPLSWGMALEEFLSNPERIGSWLESVSGERKHAAAFPEGPISAGELLEVMFGKGSTAQQCQEAAKELALRFSTDMSADIAERAYQLSTRS